MSFAIVILASGKGTQLLSRHPKALHMIGGRPLLGHVIAVASEIVATEHIYVVAGHEAARIEAAMASSGVNFVPQTEESGSGHAILCAREALSAYRDILVLPGDMPLIRAETIGLVKEAHETEQAAMTLLTVRRVNSGSSGQVVRSMSDLVSAAGIDSGMYAFRMATLLEHLDKLSAGNSADGWLLADMAEVLGSSSERIITVEAAQENEVLGVNTIIELVAMDSALRMQKAHRLMEQGVTIFKPETCVIDADVEVGPDTVIEPNVQLLGKTRIGADCLIRSGTVIENATVADGVLIRQNCVITESAIGTGAKIGPFAHLRPGSEIGEDAHVGNFVETKKAKLGKSAKANHLTYLGDTEIGAGTNIGAGVITCNYDGVNKRMTMIGAGVFVGSDSTLVAPLTIEDGAYIGAGSCITKDVPKDSLAVARARQVIKEGWAAAKRKQSEGC